MSDFIDSPDFKRYVITKARFAAQFGVSDIALRLHRDPDFVTCQTIYSLELIIAQMQTSSTTYPADWWEAFKERWAPSWFKSRYPVKYLEVKTYNLCPHVDCSNNGTHLEFLASLYPLPLTGCGRKRL